MMRWLRRLFHRTEEQFGYDCPHCGGFLETGMPDPHAARVHLREFCTALDRDEAAREIEALMRVRERQTGRRLFVT